MTRLERVRCDRCGATPFDVLAWAKFSLEEPNHVTTADLCPTCAPEVAADATVNMRALDKNAGRGEA